MPGWRRAGPSERSCERTLTSALRVESDVKGCTVYSEGAAFREESNPAGFCVNFLPGEFGMSILS